MSVAPSPCASRGQLVLQPEYFTSCVYVQPLKQDITFLINLYHQQYTSSACQLPFALFKHLWVSQGWPWLHFKVYDDRSREAFLNVTLRLFLEKTADTEPAFTRAVALFGLYTFFYTQPPSNTAPPLHSVSHIPVPIDHYSSLKVLPSLLTTPDLLPLQPYTTTVLAALLKDDVFYITPCTTLHADNPRQLPRERILDDATYVSPKMDKRKRGRPLKHDKAKKKKTALNQLQGWLEATSHNPLPSSGDATARIESTHILLANPPETTLNDYRCQKSRLLDALSPARGPSGEGHDAIRGAGEIVLGRLRRVKELLPDATPSELTGLERAEAVLRDGKYEGLLGMTDLEL
ncbi:hypothetical protein AX17_000517 [Amanita inopinata Kibby_2008]|nr:hypothetical protein AX17_000517 [Amanita inopinata Kibby_2008]